MEGEKRKQMSHLKDAHNCVLSLSNTHIHSHLTSCNRTIGSVVSLTSLFLKAGSALISDQSMFSWLLIKQLVQTSFSAALRPVHVPVLVGSTLAAPDCMCISLEPVSPCSISLTPLSEQIHHELFGCVSSPDFLFLLLFLILLLSPLPLSL